MPSNDLAPPGSLITVAAPVEARLATLLDDERVRWAALDPDLGPVVAALAELVLAGGKRLRPAFVHWGVVGAGGDGSTPDVLDAGAALELLHAFALIHDDVIDGSATRRGRRAVHTDFQRSHRDQGLRGEERRFGEGMAILVGDLAHSYAERLMAPLPAPARAVWHELQLEVDIGQVLDVIGTARGETDPEATRRITRYKSAKYTIERPLHLGAALAGRLDELAGPFTAFGLPLGEAFQLRDDVLGAFGEPALTGKPVGDDLREGKPTPLLAAAWERADPRQRALLALVGSRELDDVDVARLQAVLVDTGALDAVESEIRRLRAEALGALTATRLPTPAEDALVELADYVTARRS